ncbi:MAG: hypothetical protein JWM97_794 [Phycisphaerales bacterium]|nr:hypothetical protein [Phycisphaerales bacterium]
MSSASSVGGVGQGLYQFIRSISATSPSQPAASTDATGSTSSAQGVQGSGRHHRGGGAQFKQIQDAVTSALQQAQSSGTTADPNKIIESAIAKVLKNAGSATSSTGAAGQAASAASDGDGDHSRSTGGTTNAASSSGRNPFLKALQSLGVSPQQFHSDFLAAIQDAKAGNPNPATAFQSFPPGTTLDTIG